MHLAFTFLIYEGEAIRLMCACAKFPLNDLRISREDFLAMKVVCLDCNLYIYANEYMWVIGREASL